MSHYDQHQKTTPNPTTHEKTGGLGSKQNMSAHEISPQKNAEAMHAEIKKNWGKLTDDEIKLHDKQPDQFFSKVKEKYGLIKEDAQKKLAEIKANCRSCSGKAA